MTADSDPGVSVLINEPNELQHTETVNSFAESSGPPSADSADSAASSAVSPVKPPAADRRTGGREGKGQTTIADAVVAKVAGIATRDIPGVYALGGGAARAMGALRGAVGQTDLSQGISVEVGKTQAAVDVSLVVEYPHPLQDVAGDVRNAIYHAVEDIVGLEVTEVNIDITDVHVPSDDEGAEVEHKEPRVL
ncbi:Asp23/Gls24 family envelope stress response protein [Pseudarthrobacter psychrotolerans]|uniref:Asp23/Gls24 family envelope stress response protein n=1 Tax=Pseudarthrobacter psychrotolerans TaxID=2697569 RepID=A0A6P1NV47_9MICC|nr:Asp23/Gls24 family envelope stress response protein [Pseudarthrobacter psychrotolerans]